MSQTTQDITITARWEHDQVLQGQSARRGLLIEIEAARVEWEGTERPPVNLALVIDRSGSMGGEPMFAAIEAAVGVVDQLGPEDCLSVVAYDGQIETPVDALRMDTRGKQVAELAIRGLTARGSTDLAGGWLQGARCVARAMDAHGFDHGHVVVLTDGCANQGECDPERLAELAADLAERKVTSSCVGIGANYSPLQVTAIAEGGQGEVHQSSEPAEIIEVLAGEIGEQTRIVARNFSMYVEGLGIGNARQLTRYRRMPIGDHHEFFIGNLVGGQKRQLALLVEFDAETLGREGEEAYTVTGSWLHPENALSELQTNTKLTLDVAPAERFNEGRKDPQVTEIIATLWLARQGYEAMLHNERGDFAEARLSMDQERDVFSAMVCDLDVAPELLRRHEQVSARVAERWDGLSKKEAMILARKRMRAKPDYRAAHERREWADVDPD